MVIKAQLIDIKPVEKGTSPQGEWRKQDLIVEMPDTFQRKVCITRWNSLIDHVELETNGYYNFEIEIKSKSYNSKWFTSVIAKKITPMTQEEIKRLQPIRINLMDD